MASILVIEDDATIAEVWQSFLRKAGHEVAHAAYGRAALEHLALYESEVVLLDLSLPDIDGANILDYLEKRDRLTSTAVIVTTGDDTITRAVSSMQKGAYDYLVKPFTRERLLQTVENAHKSIRLHKMVDAYREELDRQRLGRLTGASLPMQLIYKTIEAAAPTKATITIGGEAGTERGWVAETIHLHSKQPNGPFQQINARDIGELFLGKMLFGQATPLDAELTQTGRLPGLLGVANEGTLFIDELTYSPLAVQQSLLHFLQTGLYQPEGSQQFFQSHGRIIVGLSEDPHIAIASGRLREDLWLRLNTVPIHLPPLRERRDDIALIAGERLREKAIRLGKACLGYTPEAELALMSYDWPNNTQELVLLVDQLVSDHNIAQLDLRMLPEKFHRTVHIRQDNISQNRPPPKLELVWDQGDKIATENN